MDATNTDHTNRRRSWSLRVMVASAISAVALAGTGGAVLAATTDGGSTPQGPGGTRIGGPLPGGGQGGPGQQLPPLQQQLPGGTPGQLPPATLPQDDQDDQDI